MGDAFQHSKVISLLLFTATKRASSKGRKVFAAIPTDLQRKREKRAKVVNQSKKKAWASILHAFTIAAIIPSCKLVYAHPFFNLMTPFCFVFLVT